MAKFSPFTLGPTAKAAFLHILEHPGSTARDVRDGALPDNEIGHVRGVLRTLANRGIIAGERTPARTVVYTEVPGASTGLKLGEREAEEARAARAAPEPMPPDDFAPTFRELSRLDALISYYTGAYNRAKASGSEDEVVVVTFVGESPVKLTLKGVVDELRARRKVITKDPSFKAALANELAKTLVAG